MRIPQSLLAIALMLGLTVTAFGQNQEARMKKAQERALKNMSTQLMKGFAAAKLTDEQKEKATAVLKEHLPKLMEARKAQDSILTDEQKEARKAAIAKAKEEGLKGAKMTQAGLKAMELSEEQMAKFDAAKKHFAEIMGKVKTKVTAMLTEEQQAALKTAAKGKGKGKAKKGKGKKKDGGTQQVSVNMPNMACSACAAAIVKSLGEVDGIANIATDVEAKTCTFEAPASMDVEAVLNKVAETGAHQAQGWSRVKGG